MFSLKKDGNTGNGSKENYSFFISRSVQSQMLINFVINKVVNHKLLGEPNKTFTIIIHLTKLLQL